MRLGWLPQDPDERCIQAYVRNFGEKRTMDIRPDKPLRPPSTDRSSPDNG
jgi:hypothetical protein